MNSRRYGVEKVAHLLKNGSKYTLNFLERISMFGYIKIRKNSTLEELKEALSSLDHCEQALAIYIGCKNHHPEILDFVSEELDHDVKALAILEAFKLKKYDFIDKFINSKDRYVRMVIADIGYGLEQLVNDNEPMVLKSVARSAYSLRRFDILEELEKKGINLEDLIRR